MHGRCQKRGQARHEACDLSVVGELFPDALHVPEEMGIAVLLATGHPVVATVAIDHQGARQGFLPEDLTDNAGGAGLAKEKEADALRTEEPGKAVFPVVAPAGSAP